MIIREILFPNETETKRWEFTFDDESGQWSVLGVGGQGGDGGFANTLDKAREAALQFVATQ